MQEIKTNVASRSKWISLSGIDLAWTVGLTSLAVIAPAILAHTPQNQLVTGTIVNFVLFMAAYRIGLANAIFVAVLPSSIALMRGLLPAPMAMLIPYIIISNLILVGVFAGLKKHPLTGIILAAIAKFIFLFSVVNFLLSGINAKIISMMTYPQFFTALAGGILAYLAIQLSAKKSF